MDRNEAIEHLKVVLKTCDVQDEEAVEMAIKALSLEPCDDAISRDWLKTAIHNFYYGLNHTPSEEDIQAYIDAAPSVTPKSETVTEFADRCRECGARYGKLLKQKQGKWIPCSERLPEEGESVIASTKYGVYPEARYTKEYGWEWAYEAGTDYWRELEEVEAWMPLPKRYKPQESKEG